MRLIKVLLDELVCFVVGILCAGVEAKTLLLFYINYHAFVHFQIFINIIHWLLLYFLLIGIYCYFSGVV